MTNFEKIKNMTVEEMAKWLQDVISDCDYCPFFTESCDDCYTCFAGIMKGLESEVEKNDGKTV